MFLKNGNFFSKLGINSLYGSEIMIESNNGQTLNAAIEVIPKFIVNVTNFSADSEMIDIIIISFIISALTLLPLAYPFSNNSIHWTLTKFSAKGNDRFRFLLILLLDPIENVLVLVVFCPNNIDNITRSSVLVNFPLVTIKSKCFCTGEIEDIFPDFLLSLNSDLKVPSINPLTVSMFFGA
ncbi:conserved hypothetical protein [Candida albicans WO-1]|uniref:Uncharacterized protein n=1 Tax=Candida albicans (strain WO-1) TaxID=294748 RepID=C4YK84_CANAW|nr:conserved hypothetical protein [Candida albicans WO-1]